MELKDNLKDEIKTNEIIPSNSLKGKSVKRRVESQLKNDENFFSVNSSLFRISYTLSKKSTETLMRLKL
jgi:hypothetical protein